MSSENVKTDAVAPEQDAPAAEETKTEEAPAEETKTETAETEETNMADAAPKEETVAATEAPAAEEAAPAAEPAPEAEAAPAAEPAPVEEAAAPAAEEAKAKEPATPAEEPAADPAAPEAAADQAEAPASDAAAEEPAEELPPIPEGVMGAQTMVMGDKSAAPPSRLFYKDFIPQMMQAGDKKNKVHPKFEGFKQVFYNINQFLLNNPFKVLSVEQMMLPVEWDGSIKTNDSIFNNKEMGSCNMVCCTRVWLLIKPKSDESVPDSLAYYIHKPMPSGGVSEPEQLLNLPTTIDLLNQEIKKSVIPGRIMSVQTMDYQVGPDFSPTQMLSDEFGDDTYLGCPDRCRAVTLIMVIYAQGEPLNQEIGVADFAPDVLKAPSAGTGKVFFTPFNEVLKRATAWVTANDAKFLRVTNIQIATIRIIDITPKMAALKKAGGQIDTKAMWHADSRNFPTSYLKLVRVFYVKIDSPEDREPMALSTKMIVAHKKNQQLGEPVVNVVGRANAWLSVFDIPVYGAHMVSFEYTPASPTVDVEEMCWLADKKIRTFITVVLLFLHGNYEETMPLKKKLPRSMYPVNPVDKSLKTDDKPKSSTCTVL